MHAQDQFVQLAALICEPARAKMLWSLLDGKAYTAGELSHASDCSATATSNHLAKLLQAGIVKVESQGRHRYFSIARPEVAYAVESLASLVAEERKQPIQDHRNGIRYCRTCYDHLAGFVGVQFTEAMEAAGFLRKKGNEYTVTTRGWNWLPAMRIEPGDFTNKRRPLTRQCLDWSERRPHLAGALGARLLASMLEQGWFRQKKFQRELIVTSKGSAEAYRHFGLSI